MSQSQTPQQNPKIKKLAAELTMLLKSQEFLSQDEESQMNELLLEINRVFPPAKKVMKIQTRYS